MSGKVKLVEKKVRMGHRDIIKYQLLTHCFVNDIQVSPSEMDCLTLLGAYGEYGLAEFCNAAVSEEIFKTPQTVRNFLTKAEKAKLVKKNGSNRKTILLNPDMKLQTEGSIVLNYKMFRLVTQEQ